MPAIERWSGIITGAVTPFTDDNEIDWDSLDRHLHGLAATNLTGLLVNAMMAEGGHLSTAERESTLKFAIERVGAKLPLIATIYGSSTSEAAAEAAQAARLGAAALFPASGVRRRAAGSSNASSLFRSDLEGSVIADDRLPHSRDAWTDVRN